MPIQGEVKISTPVTFSMPTSSPGRRSHILQYGKSPTVGTFPSYTPRSTHLRPTSLDRSYLREPISTSLYRTSDHSSSYSSSKYGSSGLSRTTFRSNLPGGIGSYSTGRKFDSNLETRSYLSPLSSSSALKHISSRKGSDAIHDYSGKPILTNYKNLSESSSTYSHSRALGIGSAELPRSENHSGTSVSLSTRGVFGSLSSLDSSALDTLGSSQLKVTSTSVSSGSSSSLASTKYDTDENSNRRCLQYQSHLDSNHNCILTKTSNGDDNRNAPSTSYPTRYPRHPSSSSSSSPASSVDDVSEYRNQRNRRSGSTLMGSSGIGSDASSSTGYRRISKEGMEKGGLVGLRNLGNTCFMNSVLQCLSNTRPLLDYCLKEAYLSDINTTISGMKGALIKAFAGLLHQMWKGSSSDSAVNPQAFKSQIQKFAPRFMGYSQQDAQEFLRYLLQGLHEDVNRITTKPKPILSDIDDSLSEVQKANESWRRYLRMDDSKIVDIFVGQLKSTLQCTSCGHASVTFDPFWDLSLPIPKAAGTVKLQQCFDLFTKEEVLDGDEKPTCSKCKTRRKCTKSFTIHKFPHILVIHLKRFSPHERYRSKLSTNVDFPFTNLDLGTYASSTSKSQPSVYNLYAVSNHSGTIYSGHYTAYCKNPFTNDWHDFNDSRVSSTSTNSIVSPEAYVLFYELVSQNSRL